MLKNYLKIALAVLLRRKFLTFVNLFGTVLTLTVLVVTFAVVQSIGQPRGAEHRYDHILAVNYVVASHSTRRNLSMAGPGGLFFANYIKPLRTPDLVSYSSKASMGTSYRDGRKWALQIRFTDAAYWQILDFGLLEGRRLARDDIDSGRSVAVINEATAQGYFHGQAPIGQSISIDNRSYEVVGIVRNEPETSRLAYADVWVPISTLATRAHEQAWAFNAQVMLYVRDPARRQAMRDELKARLRKLEFNPDPNQYDTLQAPATTAFEDLAARAMNGRDAERDYVAAFFAAAIVVSLLFMALPAVNLVNLNVGRIMERAPEIGIRKATGAPTRVLVGQFVFENLMLAVLGGVITLASAPFVLSALNEVFRYGQMQLNLPVLVAGLLFVTVFGVLSGAYPAWRMARLNPVSALKGQRHV